MTFSCPRASVPRTTSRSSTCMRPRWKSTASSTSLGTGRSREVSQTAGKISAAEISGPSTRRNWGWSTASAMRCGQSPTVPTAALASLTQPMGSCSKWGATSYPIQSASPSRRKSERAVTKLSGFSADHIITRMGTRGRMPHGRTRPQMAVGYPEATANRGTRTRIVHLRGRTLCAWLTPLLVGSVDECKDEARQELGLWLDRVGRDQEDGGNYFHLSLEVALAQGFKYAANRRVRHPHALPANKRLHG